MLRHGGIQEQWRDMARSTESMRQMVNDPDLEEYIAKNETADTAAVAAEENANGRSLRWAASGTAVTRWFARGSSSATRTAPPVTKSQVNPLRIINEKLDLYIGALLSYR